MTFGFMSRETNSIEIANRLVAAITDRFIVL
jgi:hypothetical protein